MKQKELSIWLRVTCLFVGLLVLIVCVLVLPSFAKEIAQNNPNLSYMYAPCLVYAVLASVPIFISLAFAWQIFTEIGRDNSFCVENAKRLRLLHRTRQHSRRGEASATRKGHGTFDEHNRRRQSPRRGAPTIYASCERNLTSFS